MLNIGSKIIILRKKRKWSQADLADAINLSREMVGKYERNENLPSLEIALKIALTFDVSLDYLFGIGKNSEYNKEMIKRLDEIKQFDKHTQETLYIVIDTFIRDYKTQQAYK